MELDAGHAWAHAELGEALRTLGRDEEALLALDRALALAPDNAWALATKGQVLRRLGRDEEAQIKRQQAIIADPEAAKRRVDESISRSIEREKAPVREVPSRLLRKNVFISYSHRDLAYLTRLEVHLRPLERDGIVTRWDDRLIKPGSHWREEIREAIRVAKVAVLLVSADFLASEFIAKNELPPLLETAEAEGATVLPVILKPCRFSKMKTLSRFQAVNSPARPLVDMPPGQRERLWVKVTEAIELALLEPTVLVRHGRSDVAS